MTAVAPYRKSILAFLALLATNIAAALTTTGQAWPDSWQDWLRWAVTIICGTWLVYQIPNRPAGS